MNKSKALSVAKLVLFFIVSPLVVPAAIMWQERHEIKKCYVDMYLELRATLSEKE